MDLDQIKHKVHLLKREIFKHQDTLWECPPQDFIEFCNPHVAAAVLDYNVAFEPDLGNFGLSGRKFVVAGSLDPPRRLISISERPKLVEQRFTLAHEVGHVVLHETMQMHRDRPMDGLRIDGDPRPEIERDADKFAALFLVSEKLLRQEFRKIFGTERLEIREDIAFALDPNNYESLVRCDAGSLDRAIAVARYSNQHHFQALHERFKVSVTTMAIRLRELELVPDWP